MKKIIILTTAFLTAFLFSCEKDPQEISLTEEEQAVILDDAASDNVIEAMDYEILKIKDDNIERVPNDFVIEEIKSIQKDPDTDYGYRKITLKITAHRLLL